VAGPVNSSKLIIIGVVWLGLVLLWIFFSPRDFFLDFGPVFGFKRTLIKTAIYTVGLLYSVFIFGWLVPICMGIYRIFRKN
jgi:hypothetical protein